MEKDRIYLYHRISSTKTLGPGERYVLWLQGCIHNCKGCVAPETHSLDSGGYWIEIDEIIEEIKAVKNLRGITISGGEPFLQIKSLLKVVREVRSLGLDVICYSGYALEQLNNNIIPKSKELLEYVDILIDGPYIEELNFDNYLRGSSNQNINHLKETYIQYKEKMANYKNRQIEITFTEAGEIFITGVPPKKFQSEWENIKNCIIKGEVE